MWAWLIMKAPYLQPSRSISTCSSTSQDPPFWVSWASSCPSKVGSSHDCTISNKFTSLIGIELYWKVTSLIVIPIRENKDPLSPVHLVRIITLEFRSFFNKRILFFHCLCWCPYSLLSDVTHTNELFYLFKKGFFADPEETETDRRVTDAFTTAFTNFAKYGWFLRWLSSWK